LNAVIRSPVDLLVFSMGGSDRVTFPEKTLIMSTEWQRNPAFAKEAAASGLRVIVLNLDPRFTALHRVEELTGGSSEPSVYQYPLILPNHPLIQKQITLALTTYLESKKTAKIVFLSHVSTGVEKFLSKDACFSVLGNAFLNQMFSPRVSVVNSYISFYAGLSRQDSLQPNLQLLPRALIYNQRTLSRELALSQGSDVALRQFREALYFSQDEGLLSNVLQEQAAEYFAVFPCLGQLSWNSLLSQEKPLVRAPVQKDAKTSRVKFS
jgi:hypothetical protein